MTAAERQRIGTTSKMVTDLVASLRNEIKTLNKKVTDLELENMALNSVVDIAMDTENHLRKRIIELKGDLSAKNIEIRRLENEILRLNMIIDEKA